MPEAILATNAETAAGLKEMPTARVAVASVFMIFDLRVCRFALLLRLFPKQFGVSFCLAVHVANVRLVFL
ncbi:hypothetical protein D3C71_1746690 [compost metagenome]